MGDQDIGATRAAPSRMTLSHSKRKLENLVITQLKKRARYECAAIQSRIKRCRDGRNKVCHNKDN